VEKSHFVAAGANLTNADVKNIVLLFLLCSIAISASRERGDPIVWVLSSE
jgi:hypothetical protein